jgi:putative tricarboxylic transport membrane protein
VAAAALIDLVLLDSAGFVLASTVLFWLTARAFDATHPARDLAIALALSSGAYVLFVRLLQLSLPPGPFAGVL